ncbi:bacterial methyltransferase, partial [Neoconidiobolus thromboides FSU 785]
MILDRYDKVKVIALDQDPNAFLRAHQLSLNPSYKGRLIPILGKFGQLEEHLNFYNQLYNEDKTVPSFEKVDGIVMDIGVSSEQIDDPAKGFSYSKEGVLDMRMCQLDVRVEEKIRQLGSKQELMLELNKKLYLDKILTAHQIVNNFSYDQLCDIIFKYGEEKFSKRIAQGIVEERNKKVINSTAELANIILKVCPKHLRPSKWNSYGSSSPHPAARTFQGLRIYINDELNELNKALDSSVNLLKPGSRLVVVSFHSLEDRLVKKFIYQHINPNKHKETINFDKKQSDTYIKELKKKRKVTHQHKLNSLLSDQQEYEQHSDFDNFEEEDANKPKFKLDVSKSNALILPSSKEIEMNFRARSAKLRYAIRT